ncbi:MFS transporter [uncultured Cohaesibacter sp.]|uniref:MFS transporter n=1 Tax=uncultured Cohaesibacter sp. TaxID=1002546 RepID=UPI002931CF27|nr:MFS transporter [uncultured Cohaesibacter sp.]
MTTKTTETLVSQSGKVKLNASPRGWSILFMCLVAYFISGALNTDGLNIFVSALSSERGWARSDMLVWSTYGGWIGLICAYYFGEITSRFQKGAQWVMVGSLVVSAIAFYFYGNSDNYTIYAICVMACSAMSLGYSFVAVNVIQTNWFPKKKGLALGISTMGFPICTMIFPAIAHNLIHAVGLEGMFTVVALFVALFAVVAFLFCNSSPEEVGQYPDNEKVSQEQYAKDKQEIATYQSPWTVRKLAREKVFWCANIGLGLMWMVTVAIVSQLVARLVGAGYERGAAIGMLSIMGFFGIFGSYLWGWIDQKVGTRNAGLLYCTWYAIALVLLIFMANEIVIYLAVFMVGVSVGGIGNLMPSMTGTIFGRKDFAAANKLASPIQSGIRSCAFLFVAMSLKITGDLTGAYIGLIGICVLSFLLISQVKPINEQ